MSLSMSATQFDVAKETIRTFAETRPDTSAVVTKDLEIVERWGIFRKIFCCCMRERYLRTLVPTKSVERFKARLRVLLASEAYKSNPELDTVCERACAVFNRLIKETNKEVRDPQRVEETYLCINLDEEKREVLSRPKKSSRHSRNKQPTEALSTEESPGLSESKKAHHTRSERPSERGGAEVSLIENYDTLIGDTTESPLQPVRINRAIAHSSDQFLRKPLGGREGPEFRDGSSPSSRGSSGSEGARADESSPEMAPASSTTACGQVLPSGKPLFVLIPSPEQSKPQEGVEKPKKAAQHPAEQEIEEEKEPAHRQRKQPPAPFTMSLRPTPDRPKAITPHLGLTLEETGKH